MFLFQFTKTEIKLDVSLYNVNDSAHSMVRSIRFDCLKYVDRSRHKFGGKLALFMQFGTFFVTRAKQDKMNVCFNFTLLM